MADRRWPFNPPVSRWLDLLAILIMLAVMAGIVIGYVALVTWLFGDGPIVLSVMSIVLVVAIVLFVDWEVTRHG